MMTIKIKKPKLTAVPFAVGRGWRGGADFLFQRKSDGRHEFVTAPVFNGVIFNAERMRRRSEDGESRMEDGFIINDIAGLVAATPSSPIELSDEASRLRWDTRPTVERLKDLRAMAKHFPPGWELEQELNGGEGIEAVIANGGEGGVAKPWHTGFGVGWFKTKRLETFYVVVTAAAGSTQSVEVEIIQGEDGRWKMEDGKDAEIRNPSSILYSPSSPRTRVPLLGGKCDRVRIGSILKVEGFGLTANGCIREPRGCSDAPGSWLVRY